MFCMLFGETTRQAEYRRVDGHHALTVYQTEGDAEGAARQAADEGGPEDLKPYVLTVGHIHKMLYPPEGIVPEFDRIYLSPSEGRIQKPKLYTFKEFAELCLATEGSIA